MMRSYLLTWIMASSYFSVMLWLYLAASAISADEIFTSAPVEGAGSLLLLPTDDFACTPPTLA